MDAHVKWKPPAACSRLLFSPAFPPRDILTLMIEFEFFPVPALHFHFEEKYPDINPLFCRNCTRLYSCRPGGPALSFLSIVFLMVKWEKILDSLFPITMQLDHSNVAYAHREITKPGIAPLISTLQNPSSLGSWTKGAIDAMMHAVAVKALQHRRIAR